MLCREVQTVPWTKPHDETGVPVKDGKINKTVKETLNLWKRSERKQKERRRKADTAIQRDRQLDPSGVSEGWISNNIQEMAVEQSTSARARRKMT